MQALFDKELTEMEREVRDLKTIHQRGLGTVRFYEAETGTVTISNSSARFTANLVAGEPTTPLAISLIYGAPPIGDFNLTASNVGLNRTVWIPRTTRNFKVKFISSSEKSGITQT